MLLLQVDNEMSVKRCQKYIFNTNKKLASGTCLFATIGLTSFAFIALISFTFIIDPKVGHPNKSQTLLTAKSAAFATSSQVFLVDILGENLKNAKRSVESFVRNNKNSEVVYMGLRKTTEIPNDLFWIDLRIRYPNLRFIFPNLIEFLQGSMLEDHYHLNETSAKHILFAKLVTLWQYGGMVTSTNWLARQPYNRLALTSDNSSLLIGVYNGEIAVLDASEPCHTLIFDLMKAAISLDSNLSSYQTDVLDAVVQKFEPKFETKVKKHFKQLGYPYFCNNQTKHVECILIRASTNSGESILKHSEVT